MLLQHPDSQGQRNLKYPNSGVPFTPIMENHMENETETGVIVVSIFLSIVPI